MAFKLELPDIGEGVVEAEVQQWFVKPGDAVEEDQPLVEVMTDKATVVIPSPRRGRIVKLFFGPGDVAKVHSPLVEMELESGAVSPGAPAPEPARPAAAARPDLGPSPGGPSAEPARPRESIPPGPQQKPLATPAVRAMAREMGIDLQHVAATGAGGRVTKDDLDAHRGRRNGHGREVAAASLRAVTPSPPAQETAQQATRTPSPRPSPPAVPGERGYGPRPPAVWGEREQMDERVPLRGLRKRIAENMARSKRTAAHFTFVEQVDVTELVRVKDRIAEAAQAEGAKVTFLPFIVKAAVAALRGHPRLNATMDEERGELVLHRRYDLGIASATEGGLIVPVLRGADRLSLLDVAREVERLSADTKAGRIRPEDLGRSTFTITSLGALGGLFATPILNHPEVGILGVHRIRPTPVVRDGEIVVRDVMHLSVTCDHRVVDGHEAAAFAYEVIRGLEDPHLLFMHMA
jgi:pyruvate dehydrogenase E2 component (dihydrolipoamide acetyltransferase)